MRPTHYRTFHVLALPSHNTYNHGSLLDTLPCLARPSHTITHAYTHFSGNAHQKELDKLLKTLKSAPKSQHQSLKSNLKVRGRTQQYLGRHTTWTKEG